MKRIAYISRAMLDSESHWTSPDLEAGSIVWALRIPFGKKFRIFSDPKALESIGKVRTHNARVDQCYDRSLSLFFFFLQ